MRITENKWLVFGSHCFLGLAESEDRLHLTPEGLGCLSVEDSVAPCGISVILLVNLASLPGLAEGEALA